MWFVRSTVDYGTSLDGLFGEGAGRLELYGNVYHLIDYLTASDGNLGNAQRSEGTFSRPEWEVQLRGRYENSGFFAQWVWNWQDATRLFSSGAPIPGTNDANEVIHDPITGAPYIVSPEGADLAFIPKNAGSAYFRYDQTARGTSINVNWSYQGSLKHFQLNQFNRRSTEPWPMLTSDAHWTADVDFEQRIGRKGWAVYGGVRNLTDYVQSDLGDLDRIHDWGPIQGRSAFVGMKFGR